MDDYTPVDQILTEAQELFDGMQFCGTHPHQVYDYELAHKLTFQTFSQWWWDCCYREARIRHHVANNPNADLAIYQEVF